MNKRPWMLVCATAVILLSAGMWKAGTANGGKVTVSTATGAITADVRVTAMPDRVVWLPAHSPGCEVRRQLRAGHGTLVSLRSQP